MAEDLREILETRTMPAAPELVREGLFEDGVRCLACAHRCFIYPGLSGVCRVRFNQDGRLYVPAGYVSGLQIDPMEKKPFYHAFPGQEALSFGMLGCSFHCGYCQNWISSQSWRDERARADAHEVKKERLVQIATEHSIPVMISTYNEPLITSEWAHEIFSIARRRGIICGVVSNGYATPEVLLYLRPVVELLKVDLKAFRDRSYRALGSRLKHVLDSIELAVRMKYWVEVVTVIVPGFNDSDPELRDMARFLSGISADIPWHVSAFRPDYKMMDVPGTSPSNLRRAYDIGREAGLHFVYQGGQNGGGQETQITPCPGCDGTLIERDGFRVLANRLQGGRCPDCNLAVPGYWQQPTDESGSGPGTSRRAAHYPPPVTPEACG